MRMGFLARLLVNAAALWVATQIVPGVSFNGGVLPFLGVALVFGVINATLRPLTKVLTFPLILLTLGLGFHVSGFWAAFFGSLVVSIVSALLSISIRPPVVYRERR